MLYLGGKGRAGKHIAGAILSYIGDTTGKKYIEPFLGGGNSFKHIAPHFQHTSAGDAHEELMLAWQAAKDGYSFPEYISEEQYKQFQQDKTPSAIRGFVGFGCSFGGKWFGGFARSKQNGIGYYSRSASKSFAEIGSLMKNTELRCHSFDYWSPDSNTVCYCDPPYANTTGYKNQLNSYHFWEVMNKWCDLGATVFVSEYYAPIGWKSIWEKPLRRKIGKDGGGTGEMVVEKLFVRNK